MRRGIRSAVATARTLLGSPKRPVTYQEWTRRYDQLRPSDRQAIAARVAGWSHPPLVSLLLPARGSAAGLDHAILSVREQIYGHWQLCLAGNAAAGSDVRAVVERHAAADSRIDARWSAESSDLAAGRNDALALAAGDYVVCLDDESVLAAHALYGIAEALQSAGDAVVVYSDEDEIDDRAKRSRPRFKPDWNPDLLCSFDYVGRLACLRRTAVVAAGGFRSGYDGGDEYDLLLRLTEQQPASAIRHVPLVLHHRRIRPSLAGQGSGNSATAAGFRRALDEHLRRVRRPGHVEPHDRMPTAHRIAGVLPVIAPRVSVIVPTRDGLPVLGPCLESLRRLTDYPDYEVIVVDNGSCEPSTLEYLVEFERAGDGRVLRMPGPFNYSRLNNRAVQEAEGDVLLLLNDDVEVVRGDWLAEMVGHAMRPEVGAVGAKLLHPTGLVQHAGVVLGLDGVAGHVHRGLPADAPGHMGRALVVQNWSAVTGACMACRRSVYHEIGGMDETSLPVSYNDVDFCLRLGRHGYRIVWTPHAVLRHRESFSRRPDTRPENRARARAEYEAFHARWPSASQQDCAFSPNLARTADGTGFACPPRTRRPWRLPRQA